MPIYEYRCPSCGFQKEHLQKMSDEPLSVCPSCGTTGYAKQLSAAGFQLKGSGWYATDFRGGSSTAAPAAQGADSAAPAATAASCAACPAAASTSN